MPDGNIFAKRLKHLSEIKKSSDIFGECSAVSCGVFCPTFGISVCAPLIQDAAVIVVGTPECVWYAKNSCIYHSNDPAYDRFYCCAMDNHDIVFGDSGGIRSAISEVAGDASVNCIILASTCIPEIIGDDMDSIARESEEETGIPVLPVHIAHYDHKCNEFGVAISRTLEALGRLMEPQEVQPMTVNLLGRHFHSSMDGSLQDSELVGLLEKYGASINLMLPDKCSTAAISSAPLAAMNIVTNAVGKDLAEYMRQRFGTPYVFFEPSLNLDYISKGYAKIQECLGINMEKDLSGLKAGAESVINNSRAVLDGKSFINGGRPPDAFEAACFLSELGMKPLLINAYRVYESSAETIEKILARGWNPYINYVANPEAAFRLIPELLPDLFVGHGNAELLKQMGIKHIEMLLPPGKLGYEAVIYVLEVIAGTLKGDAELEAL
jgi:Nitrogenase molybdenum-iron protein, alpha and beta chains